MLTQIKSLAVLALIPAALSAPLFPQRRDLLGLGNIFASVEGTVDVALSPIDAMLGLQLNLDIGGSLTCNTVNGTFGGRGYDLGCTCSNSTGGLFLEADLNAIVNVDGLEAWVSAQVDLGLNFFYPAGAQPNCDGNGGYTCPGGNCDTVTSSTASSSSTSSSSSSDTPSTTWSPTWTPSATTSSTNDAVVVSTTWTPSTTWSPTATWSPTPTWTPTPAPTSSTVNVAPAITSSASADDDYPECDDEDDETTTSWLPTSTNDAVFVSATPSADTTVTLSTLYVVEMTTTVTNTVTVTATDCATTTNDAIASSWSPSPTWTPTPSSSWTPTSSPVTTNNDVPTSYAFSFISSTTPAPSPTPSASASASACPTGQTYDIELQICVDICVDLLGLGLCANADVLAGLDL